MSGFQFIHVESYSRKASSKVSNRASAAAKKSGGIAVSTKLSVSEVVAEAMRVEGNHPHVDPDRLAPPVLLFGSLPSVIELEVTAWAESATDSKGRSLRSDGLCLSAGVISAPTSLTPDEWISMKSDSIEWLKKRYGDRLRGVIEHVDEAFRHIHFFVVPKVGEKFESIDCGRAASKKAAAEGLTKGEQNDAYKAAMRIFQDSFYSDVGMKNGLARIGPGRRRLDRVQWRQEQSQAGSLKLAIEAAGVTSAAATELKVAAQAQADESLRVKDELAKFEEVLIAHEKKQAIDRKKMKTAFSKAEKNGFAAGLAKSQKIGEVVGNVLGSISSTVKKWWHSVTRPADVGQDLIDEAIFARKKAELSLSQARTDKGRAIGKEQKMAFELVELKRQVREFESLSNKDVVQHTDEKNAVKDEKFST